MLLSYLHQESLLENITKLRPHLEKMVRDFAEEPHNTEIQELAQDDKWVSQAVDWVLQADPKAYTSKKPPERTKSPFAKIIIQWWLGPQRDITFPEDISTTRDALQQFNLLKQRTEYARAKITDYPTREALLIHMAEFGDEDVDIGGVRLPIAYESSGYKILRIDNFIPGAPGTGGEITHAAMQGASWCVKYQRTFNSYGPPYYLITRGNSKLALIHFPSLQFKNPQDTARLPSEVVQVVNEWIESNPKIWPSQISKNPAKDFKVLGVSWTPILPQLKKRVEGNNIKEILGTINLLNNLSGHDGYKAQLMQTAMTRFTEVASNDPISGMEMIDDIHDEKIKKAVIKVSLENFATGADNAKNIAELDRYLQWFWDNYKSIGDGAKIMKIATALLGTLDRLWVVMRTQNTPAKKRVQWWIQRMKSRLGKKKKAPRIVPEGIIPNWEFIERCPLAY